MGDRNATEPLSIEIWSPHVPVAYRAFLRWAEPNGAVRVLFGPDTMIAIDSHAARGYLVDEVYLVTIWIATGQETFSNCLASEASKMGVDATAISNDRSEPNPLRTIAGILKYGQDIAEVRHLL